MWLADPLGAARHGGQQRRQRRRRDPPACVWRRVLGGFGGRPLGLAQLVRYCLDLAACLAGVWVLGGLLAASCWSASVASAWLRDGWARDGGAGGNAVYSRYLLLLLLLRWPMCSAAGRRSWAC
jgi:hypothetical protein